MDYPEVLFGLVILGFVLRTILSNVAAKNRERQRRRPSASSEQSGGIFGNMTDFVTREINQQVERARTREASPPPPLPSNRPVPSSRRTAPPIPSGKRTRRPIGEDHFSETRLVREFERTHAQGKTIAHHTHDYFDPEQDKQKSRRAEARKKRIAARKAMFSSRNMKKAMILKEVLDRPEH